MIRLSSIALVVALSAPAMAQQSFPTNGVTIDSIQSNGLGCPKGSTAAVVSPDGEALTVSFSQFQATVSPGGGSQAKVKCQLHIKLSIPAGWSYALASVDYRGFIALDDKVTASRQSRYHITGESPETTASTDFNGAVNDDYYVRDIGGDAPPYQSRCGKGKNLMIQSELDIDNSANPQGTGLITVDTLDSEVYHLTWQTCS
jgi:hypothetical protein